MLRPNRWARLLLVPLAVVMCADLDDDDWDHHGSSGSGGSGSGGASNNDSCCGESGMAFPR